MLTPTTAPPPQISPEAHAELTSRTPASFADIPPILRWEDDAEVELASSQWSHWNGSAGAVPNGSTGAGVKGRLYVTEAAVTFLPAAGLPGFTLPFPSLTLHALTPAGERAAHIYCQIDEGEGEEEYAEMGEARIFVAPERLESLFGALSTCSALHDSLLPSGEPASFFGFDDDAFEDADDDDDAEGGRIRSALLESFANPPARAPAGSNRGDDEDGSDSEVDAIAAFMQKVDWHSVPAGGWEDESPAAQLEAARGRVSFLERQLREERARVAELERLVESSGGEQ